MNTNTRYTVKITNYGSIARTVPGGLDQITFDEAVDYIVTANNDMLEERSHAKADECANIDDDAEAWNNANDEAFKAEVDAIRKSRTFDDMDGHIYHIVEAKEEPQLRTVERFKSYPANVDIFTNDGVVSIDLYSGCDFGDGIWTDEEAENDAREILREHGIDDSTADYALISLIASQFPREDEEA